MPMSGLSFPLDPYASIRNGIHQPFRLNRSWNFNMRSPCVAILRPMLTHVMRLGGQMDSVVYSYGMQNNYFIW